MLDNLKRWHELLLMDGKNTKKQVREEIAEMIKYYQEEEKNESNNEKV